MTADALWLLEWSFTPADLFEEPVELRSGDCKFRIESGKVEARLTATTEDPALVLNELHQRLDALFLGAQVQSHRPYELRKPHLVKIRADSSREIFISETSVLKLTEGTVDVLITDPTTGSIIRDTRRERINARNRFAELAAARAADPVANSILRSYAAAVSDPRNELVHLYEIRDALAKRFGGREGACTALGISASSWDRLGTLANVEPLTQGRHRGAHLPGQLRDAPEELAEARAIAHEIIEAYIGKRGNVDRETPIP